jgi:signal transduction histidine kinase
VILTYSGFLLEESASVLEEEQVDFLKIIQSSSEFMLDLVNNLLDISKIEAGKLQLDLTVVNLPELVRQNVSRNRILAEKKSVSILLHHDEHIPELILDGSKIEQVLNNLIGNAIKFSPPGTSIQVDLLYGSGEVRISVHDHGPGIPAGDLERIFLPFIQTGARSTGGENGAGLGLAIVKRIVEGHGGRIWIESVEAHGSTFHVLLPGDLFTPDTGRPSAR